MPRRNNPSPLPSKKPSAHSSRKRTPPFPEHPSWTTARFWGWVRGNLRKAWLKWPPRYTVLANAKERVDGKWRWRCSECNELHMNKDVEVDHITTVGTLRCAEDLPAFVSNLFVSEDKIRVVCKSCHKRKTYG